MSLICGDDSSCSRMFSGFRSAQQRPQPGRGAQRQQRVGEVTGVREEWGWVMRLTAVYDGGLPEHDERLRELLEEGADEVHGEAAELVLLDEFVQVDGEQLEDEAEVVLVGEVVEQAQHVVAVVRVVLRVERGEQADLHQRLLVVRRLVLDDLDGAQRARHAVLALDHLAERALAQQLEHTEGAEGAGVAVQHVVDGQHQVGVDVVEAAVAHALARLGQHAARVGLPAVVELRVAPPVQLGQLARQREQQQVSARLQWRGRRRGGGRRRRGGGAGERGLVELHRRTLQQATAALSHAVRARRLGLGAGRHGHVGVAVGEEEAVRKEGVRVDGGLEVRIGAVGAAAVGAQMEMNEGRRGGQ